MQKLRSSALPAAIAALVAAVISVIEPVKALFH